MKRTTDWIRYNEGDQLYVFRCTYGFDTKLAKECNQEPHFSITGEGHPVPSNRFGRGGEYFGQCNEQIEELLPELKPLLRWHLCGMEDGPMHYIANAMYFAGLTEYPDARNIDHLKSTIVYDALDSDERCLEEELATLHPIEFRTWLESRVCGLMAKFESDIKQHAPGLWTGTEKEMGRVYSR